MGYLSYEIGGPINHSLPPNPGGKYNHGIVTPHASFLALRYAPREAVANLRALTTRFPIYSQFGFHDSVDVSAGVVTGCILAIDQGMIMAAIANELADDAMQHAFSDGPVEKIHSPLVGHGRVLRRAHRPDRRRRIHAQTSRRSENQSEMSGNASSGQTAAVPVAAPSAPLRDRGLPEKAPTRPLLVGVV